MDGGHYYFGRRRRVKPQEMNMLRRLLEASQAELRKSKEKPAFIDPGHFRYEGEEISPWMVNQAVPDDKSEVLERIVGQLLLRHNEKEVTVNAGSSVKNCSCKKFETVTITVKAETRNLWTSPVTLTTFRYKISCTSCGKSTGRQKTLEEAIGLWNKIR